MNRNCSLPIQICFTDLHIGVSSSFFILIEINKGAKNGTN